MMHAAVDPALMHKMMHKSPGSPPGLYGFPAICRYFSREPPRTRTWNLEIKSLLLCQLS